MLSSSPLRTWLQPHKAALFRGRCRLWSTRSGNAVLYCKHSGIVILSVYYAWCRDYHMIQYPCHNAVQHHEVQRLPQRLGSGPLQLLAIGPNNCELSLYPEALDIVMEHVPLMAYNSVPTDHC